MKLSKITEGNTFIYEYKSEKISKEIPVFYNPIMKTNRDFSILFIKAINKLNNNKIKIDIYNTSKELKKIRNISLPLSASGIRGVRILNEINDNELRIKFNDLSKDATKLIKKNLKLNKIKKKQYSISNKDANFFHQSLKIMDYIDIDPYGSPNPFLDTAIQNLKYGFLAITATDTAPLCGAYENMCKRKYYAKPIHNELMHEFGLRILIRKVQLIAAQYYKALIPLVSYYKDHYFRVFFYSVPTKSIVDDILKEHKTYDYKDFNLIQGNTYGPIYTGRLNNKEIIKMMLEESKKDNNISKETNKFLNNLYEEYETLGLYDLHKISKELKITEIKDYENLFKELEKEGYKYSRTIFSKYAIKTNAPISFIKKRIQK